MAAQSLTFEDVRVAVVTALKGVGVANVSVGQTTMDNAVNKALIRVLAEAPIPEHAAALYTVASVTITDGTGPNPADVLVPLAISVATGKTVQKPLKETLRVEIGDLPGTNEYCFSFVGNKIVIRPHVTPVSLHYLAVPPALTLPADAFPLGAALFNAVVLAAAQTCAEKIAGVDPQQVARIIGQYDAAIGYLTGNSNKELLTAYLAQTARGGMVSAGGQQQGG